MRGVVRAERPRDRVPSALVGDDVRMGDAGRRFCERRRMRAAREDQDRDRVSIVAAHDDVRDERRAVLDQRQA
jgi:hypothetical protein